VAYFGLVGEPDELGSGWTFDALPTPLGSFTELLLPPALPGPAGTPLTPVVPAPAEPALGVPVGLPEAAPAVDPLADPPAPCARAAIGSIRLTAAAIAIKFDFFDIGFLHVDDRVNGRRAHFVPVGSSAQMEHIQLAVGWVERSDTHDVVQQVDGFRKRSPHPTGYPHIAL
jgi:hypothetical protein